MAREAADIDEEAPGFIEDKGGVAGLGCPVGGTGGEDAGAQAGDEAVQFGLGFLGTEGPRGGAAGKGVGGIRHGLWMGWLDEFAERDRRPGSASPHGRRKRAK